MIEKIIAAVRKYFLTRKVAKMTSRQKAKLALDNIISKQFRLKKRRKKLKDAIRRNKNSLTAFGKSTCDN